VLLDASGRAVRRSIGFLREYVRVEAVLPAAVEISTDAVAWREVELEDDDETEVEQ
jgi:hypothetical protein